MVTDADFDELKESFDRYKKVVDTLLVNLLQPALDVPGTLRFGGNVMQLDNHGIQIVAPSGGTFQGALYWVPRFFTDPTLQNPQVSMAGYAAADPAMNIQTTVSSVKYAALSQSVTDLGGGDIRALSYLQAAVSAGVFGSAILRADLSTSSVWFEIQRGYLVLGSLAADPAGPQDGSIWYRSDTDVFRVRANGVTTTLPTSTLTTLLLTDTAWAAKGDLAVGTGNDTAQILSKGTDGTRLVADATGIATYGIGWKAFWYIVASCTGSGTTALSSYHKYVRFASMTGNCTATLYSAAAIGEGDCVLFKRNDTTGFNATINTTSSQTIDGALSITLAPYESALLVSNGSNWERN